MDILTPRSLKAAARERLAQSGGHSKKLALIYMGISVAAALVVTLIQFYTDHLIGNTGGLSGMGDRAILHTVQLVLQYAFNILLPFWQMGFYLVALQLYRGNRPQPASLLEGFRRWGPVLRFYLTATALMLGAVLASFYAAYILFSMTPFAIPMAEKMLSLAESGASLGQIQDALLTMPPEELWDMMKPMFFLVLLILPFPLAVLYLRFRMAPFVLMDSDNPGALMALGTSRRITRHYRMKLLKLDLSFWWYYLLMLLPTAVMYADVLLKDVVADLPVSGELFSLLCYLAGSLLQLILFWQLGSYLQATNAAAYDALQAQYQEATKPQPKPPAMPPYPPYTPYQR